METFDVVVIGFTCYCVGMLIGFFINNKKIKNLQEEVEAGDRSYMNLLDRYMELFSSHRNLKFAVKEKSSKPVAKKRGPGRPKGSKNKSKK